MRRVRRPAIGGKGLRRYTKSHAYAHAEATLHEPTNAYISSLQPFNKRLFAATCQFSQPEYSAHPAHRTPVNQSLLLTTSYHAPIWYSRPLAALARFELKAIARPNQNTTSTSSRVSTSEAHPRRRGASEGSCSAKGRDHQHQNPRHFQLGRFKWRQHQCPVNHLSG